MNPTQILLMTAELLGGLAFFLYGMSAMSGGLEQMAGGKLERTLRKVTSKGFLSFFLGAGITIAIQSSSAMTVMLVGLVNSGIIGFADTFSMIMGSHVGTTLTAWILTLSGISGDNFFLTLLRPMTFAPILAFVGIVLKMLAKRERKKELGIILIGFAVLMCGMEMMSTSMSSLQDNPSFQSMLTAFSSPAVAFLVSAAFTGIIQSSAATVAIVQALALASFATNHPITYQVAIPLVVGANVGTCVTALISAIGTSRDAKRVVALHFFTNAIGGVLCVLLLYLVMAVSPSLMLAPIGMLGVAVVHSVFNIANTVVFIPLKKPMIALCEKAVRKDKSETHTVFLDERLFHNTPIAISECKRLCSEMAELARVSIMDSIGLLHRYDAALADTVADKEKLVDKYEDKLGTYLVKLSNNNLSASDSHSVGRLLHSIGDFERISDHALSIAKLATEIHEKELRFSGNAEKELETVSCAVKEIIDMTVDSFVADDTKNAAHVEPLEQIVDKLKKQMKQRHIERLQKGECTIEQGFVFTDLLTNFERISDHCSNVAVYTMQLPSDVLDTHKYLNRIKNSESGAFVDDYNMYDKKYQI